LRYAQGLGLVEFAAFAAVEVVDEEADDEPDEEADPGDRGEARHEESAEEDAQDGEERASRDAEAAMPVRLLVAQDEDADRDQDEGEESTDVGHFGEAADVEEARWDGDQDARDDGGEGRRAEARMDLAEGCGEQAVAGHGEPDARLAVLAHHDGGEHTEDGAEQDEEANKVQAVAAGLEREALECVDYRRSVVGVDGVPVDDAGEGERDADVQDGADDERGDDADGDVALGVLALFGGGGDGVETDVGEEDDGASGEDSGDAVGDEGVVVAGMDEGEAEEDEGEDGGDFDHHHDVVGAGGLADPDDEDGGEDTDDEEGGNIEAAVPAGSEDGVSG